MDPERKMARREPQAKIARAVRRREAISETIMTITMGEECSSPFFRIWKGSSNAEEHLCPFTEVILCTYVTNKACF